MKILAIITACFISTIFCSAQNMRQKYIQYAQRVQEFNAANTSIHIRQIENNSKKELDIKNNLGDILRFKVDKLGNLLSYYEDLSFIRYHFTGRWITSIHFYNPTGSCDGLAEFNDLARVELVVKEPIQMLAKLKIISDQEGNITMNDESENLVLKREFNTKNNLIQEYYITSKDYWNMQQLFFRP
jgi:hypothetical protein